MRDLLEAIDFWIATALRWLVILAIVVVLLLVVLGVIARTFPVFSMSGYDEIIEFLVAWMTFAGAVALWREGSLFRVDLMNLLPFPRIASATRLLVQVLMLLFAVVFTTKTFAFTAGSIETMPFLGVSKQAWYAAMPVSGLLMTAYSLAGIARRFLVPRSLPAAAE